MSGETLCVRGRRVPRSTKGSVINTYDHPALGWMLDHWHAMIMLSGCVLLLGAFALMTRWWNRKDEAAQLATYRRADQAGSAIGRSARR